MTSAFRSRLILEDEGGRFRLAALLVYESAVLARTLSVPIGFQTDLASIPRVLWNVLPPIGKYDGAAVVHDYLYRVGGVSRAQADGVLLEAMTVLGVGWWTRRTIWLGVRVGGWAPWDRYRQMGAAV